MWLRKMISSNKGSLNRTLFNKFLSSPALRQQVGYGDVSALGVLGDHERDQLILRGSEIQNVLLELNFKGQIGKNHVTQGRASGAYIKAEEPGKADASGEFQAFNTDSVRYLPM